MLVSVMFQQIYNIADSMIAGKFVGENALAAVGAYFIRGVQKINPKTVRKTLRTIQEI